MQVTTGPWGLYAVIFVAVMALLCVVAFLWQGRQDDRSGEAAREADAPRQRGSDAADR